MKVVHAYHKKLASVIDKKTEERRKKCSHIILSAYKKTGVEHNII